MFRFARALIALSTVSLIVLTGCGAATSFSNPTASAKISGKIFGGQQPVANSTVTVWEAGTGGYGSAATSLATTTTLDDGSFTIGDNAYTCTAGEQVYITASGGNSASPDYTNPHIMLATGLGDCTAARSATVEINEVTTVATAFALAQFFTTTLGSASTDSFGTNAGDLPAFTLSNESTIPLLVDILTGTVKPNTSTTTIEAAKIYSMANILAACVNDAADLSNCGTLFQNTTPPTTGATAPYDTLQAAVQMALYPYQNVQNLYQLASSKPPFVGLGLQPNDWTIGVAYTSNEYALGVAGSVINNPANGAPANVLSATSASIDIDANGRVWFPTNLSGSTGVAYFDPASTMFNGPYISGLVQPQYVAIDNSGTIWVSDSGGPNFGHTSTVDPVGTAEGDTFGSGLLSLGPVAGDGGDNMIIAYVDQFARPGMIEETALSYSLLDADPAYPVTGLLASGDSNGNEDNYTIGSGNDTPCAEEYFSTDPNNEYISYGTVAAPCSSGGIVFGPLGLDAVGTVTSQNTLISAAFGTLTPATLNLPEGIATDGDAYVWVANSGNASIAVLQPDYTSYATASPVAYLHDATHGNTMTTPYAIAIDGSGNVWVANAGCVTSTATSCTPGPFVLSELIGAAAPSIAPLSLQMVDGVSFVGVLPGTDTDGSPDAKRGALKSSRSAGIKARPVPVIRH